MSHPGRPAEVLVIDDHPVVRLGVEQMLATAPDLRLCAAEPSLVAALRRRDLAPDLCLLDLQLAESDGLDAIGPLRRRWPRLGILIYSVRSAGVISAAAVERGADGFVPKDAPPSMVLGALRTVRDQGRMLDAATAEALSRSDGQRQRLTPREEQVLTLLAEGLGTTQIAGRLQLTPQTVSTHKRRLLDKLGADSFADLIRIADQRRSSA